MAAELKMNIESTQYTIHVSFFPFFEELQIWVVCKLLRQDVPTWLHIHNKSPLPLTRQIYQVCDYVPCNV